MFIVKWWLSSVTISRKKRFGKSPKHSWVPKFLPSWKVLEKTKQNKKLIKDMCYLDFSKTKPNIHPTYVLKPSVCSCQAFWLSRLEKHPAVLWDGSCGIAVQTGITAAPCRMLPASAGYCWPHAETRRLQGWIGASMHLHWLFFFFFLDKRNY